MMAKFPTTAAGLASLVEQKKEPLYFVLVEEDARFAKYSPAFSTIFGHSYIDEHHKGTSTVATHLKQHLIYVEPYNTRLGQNVEIADFRIYNLDDLGKPVFSNREHAHPLTDFRF